MADIKKKDDRFRNFVSVVYPEDLVENWADVLAGYHVPCFISPLHTDVDPSGEHDKKPHYHVMLMFEGKKSLPQVQEIFLSIGSSVLVQTVESLRGMARYLCHLDDPSKKQYDVHDVLQLSGADYMHIIGLAQDKYKAISEMIEFVRDNDIRFFSDLLDVCAVYHYDWFVMLCDKASFVMQEYIKSYTYKMMQNKEG